MDAEVRQVMEECTKASDEERITFGEVVSKLMQAGVERYHADLLLAQKTYFLPSDESLVAPCAPIAAKPQTKFSAAGVEAAVRAIQAKAIEYREFCERIAAAGCVGYLVSLAGRCAVYYGRTGETYVEPFPAAR